MSVGVIVGVGVSVGVGLGPGVKVIVTGISTIRVTSTSTWTSRVTSLVTSAIFVISTSTVSGGVFEEHDEAPNKMASKNKVMLLELCISPPSPNLEENEVIDQISLALLLKMFN